jgi:hypothetical protein
VSANSTKIANVADAPITPAVFWNFWQWQGKK